MMRYISILFFAISIGCFAQKATVKHVVTHNRATIICDPSGVKSFKKMGTFPSEKTAVRKIMMNVTLGRADSLFAAHWDYLDHIKLRKKDANGKWIEYELGRMLTPYGSIYNKGWNWTWQVDVTDFAPFLRDNVEIDYIHTGYESKAVGWALTIDFEIMLGPPVAEPLGVTTLWNDAYKYGDPKIKIEDNLRPISYESAATAEFSRIRIQHTGHGSDRPKGCSEFCSRWRDLKVDGKTVDHRDMWKDCGGNPLYPQGGTWVSDRAYWCPGDLQVPDVFDVKLAKGKHTVSLDMEPYTATANIQAEENISAYLFQYAAPSQKVDVAIDRIVVPNNEQQYSRLNPASFNPHFVIRNLGSQNLRSVVVTYGTEGFPTETFHWKGNLAFNQTTEIVIPGEIKCKSGKNSYTVTLTKPNGGKDGWMGDNVLTSTFESTKVLPTSFVIQYHTNNHQKDNTVFLIDKTGDTIFHKLPSTVKENTVYNDTIHLKEGKYELGINDKAGDGLEFWAGRGQGDGYLRLFDLKGNLIHAFESDFGNFENLNFTASASFKEDELKDKYAFSVYPRSVSDKTELSVVSNKPSKMTVLITIDGIIYEQHDYVAVKDGVFPFSMDSMPPGRIIFEVLMDGVSKFKVRLNKANKGSRF